MAADVAKKIRIGFKCFLNSYGAILRKLTYLWRFIKFKRYDALPAKTVIAPYFT